ncbi:MAG: DDE-type integrase/transposase/recombinase [Actinomycetota bacterium]
MDTHTPSSTVAPPTTSRDHVHFRPTTASQRQFLFEEAEQNGNVSAAAHAAHVGRGTYYYWHPRWLAEGADGLAQPHSRAPQHPRLAPVSAERRQEVLDYAQAHPGAGSRTIANRLRQAHDWQKVISHTKVREILQEAQATPPAPVVTEAAAPASVVVHAPRAEQTLNIDLCVVAMQHTATQEFVSLSWAEAAQASAESLAGEPPPAAAPSAAASEPAWPGQVFGEADLPYAEQMKQYAARRQAKRASKGARKGLRRQKAAARRTALNQQADELRVQRRRQRQERTQEDEQWRTVRATQQADERTWQQLSPEERQQRQAERYAQKQAWRKQRVERRRTRTSRQAEDQTWREQRQAIRAQEATVTPAPLLTLWLAILVIVDNGTRRCISLPLFTAGVHTTAEMIVQALRAVWPADVEFVISDNGAQFIAAAFQQFAYDMGFLHVRIAPHRPCTNGIAERFVLTLKEWLQGQTWETPAQLAQLLADFQRYYNDRPHQGAELQGLSPNEFARRLADCSTS